MKMTVKDSLMMIEDFRIDRCKKHNLIDILMIVFFGLLCGFKSIEEIHFYAELIIDVLTIDAMGCQKKIAEKITKKHSDYLFSLKGNQEIIHDITKAFFSCNPLDEESCRKDGIQKPECETEVGHGRVEKREYFLCTDLKWFIDKTEWVNLNGIGMVRSWRLNKKTGEESCESRYFITSLKTVERAAHALRSH